MAGRSHHAVTMWRRSSQSCARLLNQVAQEQQRLGSLQVADHGAAAIAGAGSSQQQHHSFHEPCCSAPELQQGAHSRLTSQWGASTSSASSSWHQPRPQHSGEAWWWWQHPHQQHQASMPLPSLVRGLKVLRRRFQLPDDLREAVERQLEVAKQKPPPPEVPPPQPRPLAATSRRVGCIAFKAGMTQEWDEHGVRVPLTVLWIDDCQVVGVRWPALHGTWSLQLGAGHSVQDNLHPGQAGFYLKQGLPMKALMHEFPVSEDALLPVGTHITAAHFVTGQHVDVTGWTKNKGFQGVMKRHGFKGLPASHGVSLAHRSPGSIGNRTSPGKVWKGKRMPGQMGDERRTVHNCLVYKVDAARNLVFVRGQLPGPAGQHVLLRDALNTRHDVRLGWNLPHPTHCGPGGGVLSDLGPAGVAVALACAQLQEQQRRLLTARRKRSQPAREASEGLLDVPDPQALLEAAKAMLPKESELPDITVYRQNPDPYIPYRKETDYVEVKWKKGD